MQNGSEGEGSVPPGKMYHSRAAAHGLIQGEQQFPPMTGESGKGARFTILAGAYCLVSPLSPLSWRRYVTQRELRFERFERYKRGWYTFREQGFLISIWRGHVLHREDRRL
jgi:hypothetical protein